MAAGWLCFQAGHEKYRVAPVPGDWLTLDEYDLEALRRKAMETQDGNAPPE